MKCEGQHVIIVLIRGPTKMPGCWKRKEEVEWVPVDTLTLTHIELDTWFTFTGRIHTKRVRQRVESELGWSWLMARKEALLVDSAAFAAQVDRTKRTNRMCLMPRLTCFVVFSKFWKMTVYVTSNNCDQLKQSIWFLTKRHAYRFHRHWAIVTSGLVNSSFHIIITYWRQHHASNQRIMFWRKVFS
jgi:hypothetical protein